MIGSKNGFLYALEVGTGKLRWKTRAGEVLVGPAVIGESVIYIQAWGLQALNPADGKDLWHAGLGTGVQNAPVISGKTMYVTSADGDVYALE